MKISAVKSALNKVAYGAWVRDIPIEAGLRIALKVRGIRNPDAGRVRDEVVAALSPEQSDNLPPEVLQAILVEVLAQSVVLDWDLTDDDEVPLACTPDSVREFLTDELVGKAFREAALYASGVVAERGVESLEDDAKN